MNEELKDKLNALCEEMAEHVKYLRDMTYHPYDKSRTLVTSTLYPLTLYQKRLVLLLSATDIRYQNTGITLV